MLFNNSHFGQYEVGKNKFVTGRKEFHSPLYAYSLAKVGYEGLYLDSKTIDKKAGVVFNQP